MSVEEIILFVAVIALALALVAVVVGPKLVAGRRRDVPAGDRTAADTVSRAGVFDEQPPRQAQAPSPSLPPSLVPPSLPPSLPSSLPSSSPPSSPTLAAVVRAEPPPAPAAAWGCMVCPTCRRQFATGLRFCPYDARLLTAEGPGAEEREPSTDPALRPAAAKICPTCARRYESVAVVCASDGALLVSVN